MYNNAEITTRYDAKYDIIKFILAILVLAIHASLFEMILYPWLRVAVPLFFMISSYFVFSKLHNAPKDKQKTILKKFALRNVQLYLCWCVILLPITLYLRKDEYFANGFLENTLTIIKSILFSSTFVASWFITATVIGVVIIYFLCKWLKHNFIVLLISLFAFCIVTLQSSYSFLIADTFVSTAIDIYIDIFSELVCSFPASLLWIFIGKLFAENKLKIKSLFLLISLILCSCVGLYFEWKFVLKSDGSYSNDSYFMLAPLCILLFALIQNLKPVYWEKSVYFKRASTVIYVTHGSLIPIVAGIISRILHIRYSLVTFVATFMCCIVIYIFVEMLNKKFSNNRIGKILKMLY